MAELHDALAYLKPVAWEDVPTISSVCDLHQYVSEIINKARLIAEIVPEQNPSSVSLSDVGSSAASIIQVNASDSFSQEDLELLRKEWGKPLKMNNAKENPLNISIYKMSGTDGKGAWFARRSVHKGLPFSRWRLKMQAEMRETLEARQKEKAQGQVPGMSIRGIGGDRKLADVPIRDPETNKHLGQIEVYELSAQFPGPTTPRDFVTLMIKSDVMPHDSTGSDQLLHPTFMIVSKPCEHPDAPVRDDYIRGQYEAVELIREIPIQTHSTSEIHSQRLSSKRSATTLGGVSAGSPSSSPSGRPRGKTEPPIPVVDLDTDSGLETEDLPNPVEWIMITRSDPGGSVPRWIVERETPKTITGDAVKFLNWASQADEQEDGDTDETADIAQVTESVEKAQRASDSNVDNEHSSTKDRTVITDQEPHTVGASNKEAKNLDQSSTTSKPADEAGEGQKDENTLLSIVFKMVQSGLHEYAPKAVLNYVPNSLIPSPAPENNEETGVAETAQSTRTAGESSDIFQEDDHKTEEEIVDDTSSSISNDSFANARSHLSPSASRVSRPGMGEGQISSASNDSAMAFATNLDSNKGKPSQKEKEMAKLNAKKREIEIKLSEIRSAAEELLGKPETVSVNSDVDSNSDRGTKAHKKEDGDESGNNNSLPQDAQKRIDRLSRSESKLVTKLNKIEAQQLKLIRKVEADQRKAANKDEKTRSKSETDSLKKEISALRQEVSDLRDERTKWLDIVGKLQRENTALTAQMQKDKHGVLKDTASDKVS